MKNAQTSSWNEVAKYIALSIVDIGVLFAVFWIIRNI